MVRVAVAGGTAGIGRTVVEAIVATKKHDVFVLSRSNSDVFGGEAGVTVLAIDYSYPNDIAATLAKNQIHTIISCVSLSSEEANESQLHLIEGASNSGSVVRFAPSEFGIDYVEATRRNFAFPFLDFKIAAIKKLQAAPSLKYTRFISGTFMDYLGPPTAPTHLPIISLIVDVESNKAAVPGDGKVPTVFTHSTDVARFVAGALSLDEWPEASVIIGDRITLNRLVSLAETGKGCKFDVTYDTVDDLRAGKNTELPANISRYAFVPKARIDGISQSVGLAIQGGWLDLKGTTLNDLLPHLKPMSVEGFLNNHPSSK